MELERNGPREKPRARAKGALRNENSDHLQTDVHPTDQHPLQS